MAKNATKVTKSSSKSTGNSWFKNATKAVGYSALEVAKESNPFIAGTVGNTMNAFSDLKTWVKNSTPFRSSSGGNSQEKKLYKTVSNLVKAGFDDIKSGHLDFAGLNETVGKMLGNVTEDLEPWADDNGEISSFDFDAGLTNDTFLSGVEVQAKATVGAIEQGSNIIARSQAQGLDILAKRNQVNSLIMTSKITEQLITSNKYMDAMNNNLATIVQQNNDFTEFRNAQLRFMENTEQGINDIREVLTKIADMNAKMVPQERRSYGRQEIDFISGGFDIKELGRNIWENSLVGQFGQMGLSMAAPYLGFLGFDVSKIDSFGGMGGDLNPVKMLLKSTGINKAFEKFNQTLENYTRMAFAKLGEGGMGFITSMLGLSIDDPTKLKSSPSMGRYEKGVAAWTGYDSRALREVIPGYLSKIEANTSILAKSVANLSGDRYNEEVFRHSRHFDESSGVFRSSEDIMKEFQENLDYTISGAASQVSDMIARYTDGSEQSQLKMASVLNDIYNRDGFTSKDDIKSIGKIIKDHLRSVSDEDDSQEARVIRQIQNNPKVFKNLIKQIVDDIDQTKIESARRRDNLFDSISSRDDVAYRLLNDRSGMSKRLDSMDSQGIHRGTYRATNLETLEAQEQRRYSRMTAEERRQYDESQKAKDTMDSVKGWFNQTAVGKKIGQAKRYARDKFGMGDTDETKFISGRGINRPLNFLSNGAFGLLHGGFDALDFDDDSILDVAIDPRVRSVSPSERRSNNNDDSFILRNIGLSASNQTSGEVHDSLVSTIPELLRQIAENTRNLFDRVEVSDEPIPSIVDNATGNESTEGTSSRRRFTIRRRRGSITQTIGDVEASANDIIANAANENGEVVIPDALDPERARRLNDEAFVEASGGNVSFERLRRNVSFNDSDATGRPRDFVDRDALRSEDPTAALQVEMSDNLAGIRAATAENNKRLFGKEGFITTLINGTVIGKLLGKLKGTLFGTADENGVYKDGPMSDFANALEDAKKSVSHFFTGSEYTDSMGKKYDANDNAVFKHLGRTASGVHNSFLVRFFGNDYKNNEHYQNLPNFLKDKEDRVSNNDTRVNVRRTGSGSSSTESFDDHITAEVNLTDQQVDEIIEDTRELADQKINETLMGDDAAKQSEAEIKKEKLFKGLGAKIQKAAPGAVAAGIVGSLVGSAAGGIIPTLFGVTGPIGGAIAGIGISLLSQSDTLKEKLFGKENEDGTKVGGIISDKFQKLVKSKMPWIVSGGLIGAAKAIIAPSALGAMGAIPSLLFGGVLGPAIIGSGLGLLASSETFKKKLFGERTGDGDKTEGILAKIGTFITDHGLKPALAGIGGAGAGALLSAIGAPVLGPAGPILSAIAGASIGIMGSSKNFNEMLFGSKILDENGNVVGRKRDGMLDKFGNFVKVHFDEVAVYGKHMMNEAANFIKADLMAPLKTIGASIADSMREVVGDFKESLAKVTNSFVKGVKSVFSPIGKAVKDITHGLLRGGMKGFEMVARTTGFAITAPLKLGAFLVSDKRTKKAKWGQLKHFLGTAPSDFLRDLSNQWGGEDSPVGRFVNSLADKFDSGVSKLKERSEDLKQFGSFLINGTWYGQQVFKGWQGFARHLNAPQWLKDIGNWFKDGFKDIGTIIATPFKNWAKFISNPLAPLQALGQKLGFGKGPLSTFKNTFKKHVSREAFIQAGIDSTDDPVAKAAFEQQLAKLHKKNDRKNDKNKDKLNKLIRKWAANDNYDRTASIASTGKYALATRKAQIAKLTGLTNADIKDWTQEDVKNFMYDFGARGDIKEFKTIAQQAKEQAEAKAKEQQETEKTRENISTIADNTAEINENINSTADRIIDGMRDVARDMTNGNLVDQANSTRDDSSSSIVDNDSVDESDDSSSDETASKKRHRNKSRTSTNNIGDTETAASDIINGDGSNGSSSNIDALDPETASRLNSEAFLEAALGQSATPEQKETLRQLLENPTSPVQAPNLTNNTTSDNQLSNSEANELRKNENVDKTNDRTAIAFGNEVSHSLEEMNEKKEEEAKDEKEDDAAKDRIFRDEERDRYGNLEDQEEKSKEKSKEDKKKDKEKGKIRDLIMDVLGKVGTVLLPFVAPFAISNWHKLPELIFNVLPNLLKSISSGISTAAEFAGDLLNITKENIIPKIDGVLDAFRIGEGSPSDFRGSLAKGENPFSAASTALFGLTDNSDDRSHTYVMEDGSEVVVQGTRLTRKSLKLAGKAFLKSRKLDLRSTIKTTVARQCDKLAQNIADGLGKAVKKVMPNAAENSSIFKKIGKFVKEILTNPKVQEEAAKNSSKLAAASAETAAGAGAKAIPVAGWIIAGIGAVWDATTGALDAANLFYVDEDDVTARMRTVSAIMKTFVGLFTVTSILDVINEIVALALGIDFKCALASAIHNFIWDEEAEALTAAQSEFQKELDAYNVANNTNLSSKEYNDMKNMTVEDGIFYEVKSWFSKPQHKTGTTVSSANNRYQNQSVENQASESLGYGKLTDNHTGSGDHYTQGDSRWRNINFGKMTNGTTTTIGTGGCGPTALANVYRNITGRTDVTPTTVANMAIDNGYTTNGGSNAGLFTEGAGKLGLATQRIGPNDLGNALSRGDSLILSGVKKGSGSPYTTSGHIISVKGMKNGKAIVQDPMKSSSTTMPLSNLTAGLNKAWAVTGANGYGNMSWDSSSNIGYGPIKSVGFTTDENGNTITNYSFANAYMNKRYPIPLFFDDTLASGEQNYYCQGDPEWGGQKYGNSTVGSVGCLLSSMGMAMSAMTGGLDFSPGFLSKMYPAVDGGLGGAQAEDMATLIGATYHRDSITSLDPNDSNSSYWKIIEKLKMGYPVILSSYTNGWPQAGSHHYLLNGLHEGRISSANLEGDGDDAHWTMLFDPASKDKVGAINLREMLANAPGRLGNDAKILSYNGERYYTTTVGPSQGNGQVKEYRWFERSSDFTDYEGLFNTLNDRMHNNADIYHWIRDTEYRINELSETDRPWFDEDFDELNNNPIYKEVFTSNLTDNEKNALNAYNGLPTSNLVDEGVMNANDGTSGMDKITGGFSQLFENISKVAWNILDAILTGGDYKSIFSGDRFISDNSSNNSTSSIYRSNGMNVTAATHKATTDNNKFIAFGKSDDGKDIFINASKAKSRIVSEVFNKQKKTLLDKYCKEKGISEADKKAILDNPNSVSNPKYARFLDWSINKIGKRYEHAVRYNQYKTADGKAYQTATVSALDAKAAYSSASHYSYIPTIPNDLPLVIADTGLKFSTLSGDPGSKPVAISKISSKYEQARISSDGSRHGSNSTMDWADFDKNYAHQLTRDLRTFPPTTVSQMNKMIDHFTRYTPDSPFIGRGQDFIDAANLTGIDPRMILAQSGIESAWGTSRIARTKGNLFGIGADDKNPYGNALAFLDENGQVDWRKSIINGAQWISTHFINRADGKYDPQSSLATLGWSDYHIYGSGYSDYGTPFRTAYANGIAPTLKTAEGYGDLDKSLASYKMSSKVKRTVSAPTFKSSEKGSSGKFTSTKYTPRTASVHSGHSFHSGRSLGYGTAASMFTSVDMTPMENKTDKLIYLLEKVVTNTAKAASNTSSSTNITNYNTNTTTRNEIAYGDVNQDSGSSNVVVVEKGNSNKINQVYKDKLRAIHEQIARSPRH